MLLLVKCYDNKMVKSPYNCFIFPFTQPQMANQQQQKNGLFILSQMAELAAQSLYFLVNSRGVSSIQHWIQC